MALEDDDGDKRLGLNDGAIELLMIQSILAARFSGQFWTTYFLALREPPKVAYIKSGKEIEQSLAIPKHFGFQMSFPFESRAPYTEQGVGNQGQISHFFLPPVKIGDE